jgi:hypothetical protein
MSPDIEVDFWVGVLHGDLRAAWRGDLRGMLHHLIQAGSGADPRALAFVCRKAQELVAANWFLVERVAQALAERGRSIALRSIASSRCLPNL